MASRCGLVYRARRRRSVSGEHARRSSISSAAVVHTTEKPARTAWWAMFLAIMVLPRPLVPMRARFLPSRMKSRVSERSMRSRSIFFGQFQSNSAIGLKRPMRARLSRFSRLLRLWSISSRRAISSSTCTSERRPLVARARKSSSMRAMACRPILSRRPLRSVGFVVVIVAASELIVGLRRMGFDVEVLEIGTAREIDGQGDPALRRAPTLGEQEDDRADVGGVPLERLGYGGAQLHVPVVVEQEQQLLGDGPHGFTPLEARFQ